MIQRINISEILLSPWSGIVGLVVGCIIGFEFQSVSETIAPFGDIYLALLQMCVLPLIISAVINSFANLTRSTQRKTLAMWLVAYFIIFMVGAAFIGFLLGFIGGTGYLDEDSKSVLGQLFLSFQDETTKGVTTQEGWGLVNNLIPTNFFEALSEGRKLEVIFFSVLLGVALGLVKSRTTSHVIEFFNTIFDAIFVIIKWILHGLPFGIACIIAKQISSTGFETIMSLLKFVSFFCLGAFLMLAIYTMIMTYVSKRSPIEILSDMQETLLIAIGTQSFIAVIPQLIDDLEKNFKFSKEATHLIVPLGATINRQGIALLFALTGITVAQMYDIALGPFDVLLLILGTAFIAMAAIGPLYTIAPIIAFIFEPLGLPSSAGIVFITAAAPILTPFAVMMTAQGIATLSTLLFSKVENGNNDELDTEPDLEVTEQEKQSLPRT